MELTVKIKPEHSRIGVAVLGAYQNWMMTYRSAKLKEVEALKEALLVNPEVKDNFTLEIVGNPKEAIITRRFNIFVYPKNIRWDKKDWYILFVPKTKLGCEFEGLVKYGKASAVINQNHEFEWRITSPVTINVDGRIYDKCSN